jgi:siroheme synthase (precorrin-2 oxidase/ferrochelatase)
MRSNDAKPNKLTASVHPERARRVAVLGGDGRQPEQWAQHGEVVCFQSPHDGGNGEQRRLMSALRSNSFTLVIILTRWNSHAVTRMVRQLCRQRKIPVQVVT